MGSGGQQPLSACKTKKTNLERKSNSNSERSTQKSKSFISKEKPTKRRYYYTSNQKFEQSLDIYTPSTNTTNTNTSHQSKPLVILVVGSAWMGHTPWIYTGTSWWNSSGPTSIVQSTGCTCIAIRHRGAFPHIPFRYDIQAFLLCVGIMTVMPRWIGPWNTVLDTILITSLICVLVVLSWRLFVIKSGKGCAEFEDMLNDVSKALVWVRDMQERNSSRMPIIFGGYSSGGHVAASLLLRRDILKQYGLLESVSNLSPDELFCDGVLYVSAVLAVRVPSVSLEGDMEKKKKKKNDEGMKRHPTWLTDIVCKMAFGFDNDGSSRPSSPPCPLSELTHVAKETSSSSIKKSHYLKKVPHLLIGCENELIFSFINLLDTFFSIGPFVRALEQLNGNNSDCFIRKRLIKSNHWTMLFSDRFCRVLSEEIGDDDDDNNSGFSTFGKAVQNRLDRRREELMIDNKYENEEKKEG